MILFPNSKINLGLNIIKKREDGYHELETVFYPVNICDALEVIIGPETTSGDVTFTSTGLENSGTTSNNLCIKAHSILKKDFGKLPAMKMHLHKAIPLGAGLGGGSADGAFTLLLLNRKFHLNLTIDQLRTYALQLGSDCPFFIINAPCFAKGRGELLQEISLHLSEYKFLIVKPGIHINTQWAFSQIQPSKERYGLLQIIQEPVQTWRKNLVNDFEIPVFHHHPTLAFIKEQLYKLGAVYASMSGSGSTFYGLFSSAQEIPAFNWSTNYYVKEVQPLNRFWLNN